MPLRPGDRMPDVELTDHTGAPWRLTDQLDHRLLLILHRHLL
jgi:peroxiredoxin